MILTDSAHNPSRQQGYPPAQPLQPIHQRPHPQPQRSFSISQQPLPDTSQPAGHPASPASFTSPHLPNHPAGSQRQAVYGSPANLTTGQNSQSSAYYSSQPNIYNSNGIVGNYQTAGKPSVEMATAHTMSRNHFPPMFHPPPSTSQAPVPSPQHDPQGRTMYGQPPSHLPPTLYYPYQMSQHSPYAQAAPPPRHPHMTTASAPITHVTGQPIHHSSQPHTPQQQQQPSQHHHQHQPSMAESPHMKMTPGSSQRQTSGLSSTQQTPTAQATPAPTMLPSLAPNNNNGNNNSNAGNPSSNNPNAAPGPIPATTPLVVKQDPNGVQWIAFEYSKDRVKLEYLIRCDVESVNVDELPPDFKSENCVYPRACCNKDQYKGNRLQYETECNTVGWALAQLNTVLRGKRGLIQRAVDSWRNSNQDPKLRSRRVRRQAKNNTRKANIALQQQSQLGKPGGAVGMSSPTTGITARPATRQPSLSMAGSQTHNHVDSSASAITDENAGTDYGSGSRHHHHQAPNGQSAGSLSDIRPSHNFYPTYPTAQNLGGNAMTPMHAGLNASSAPMPHTGSLASANSKCEESRDRTKHLFGGVSEEKRRKFILVDDAQRSQRVRVRVTLDNVMLEEMPDSYRKSNSVYPRSFFPMQLQSPPSSPTGGRFFNDPDQEDDGSADDGRGGVGNANKSGKPTVGRTLVPVTLMDGSEAKVPLPRIVRPRRGKELALNDLGYRMSWIQGRVFSGRHLFLQKSLDAYRNKICSTLAAAGQDVSSVAPHFETRVGKRRWTERKRQASRSGSP